MKLLIISHTAHYKKNESYVGWGSTIREINHLASLFDELVHLAPLHKKDAPGSSLPYTADNIRLAPVAPAGGNSLKEKLSIVWRIPGWLSTMKREMGRADILHIRCPAGISLLALIAARLWFKGKPIWVKYGGNWGSYPGQPLSYKIQRWYLNNPHHKVIVTINGKWDDQPKHVYTFKNPSLTTREYEQAANNAKGKSLSLPVRLLFVGRVSKAKGVDRLLQITEKLSEIGQQYHLTLVGDGPERADFESFAGDHSLGSDVHFTGWQPLTALSKYYQGAHIFVFPSTSEGWPKVLSEAMAHGVVPIASAIASIPQILGETCAGLALPSEDIDAYVDAIISYTNNEKDWKQASMNGIQAGAHFTYEHYLDALREAFFDAWGLTLQKNN